MRLFRNAHHLRSHVSTCIEFPGSPAEADRNSPELYIFGFALLPAGDIRLKRKTVGAQVTERLLEFHGVTTHGGGTLDQEIMQAFLVGNRFACLCLRHVTE